MNAMDEKCEPEEMELPPSLSQQPFSIEQWPEYLTVKEVASMLGVSERSVYGYIERGELRAARLGEMLGVMEEDVSHFQRKAPGRTRSRVPEWHIAPAGNLPYLTTIVARTRPGQRRALEQRLQEVRDIQTHCMSGTAARYIVRNNHDPDEITILLLWRGLVMPPSQERMSAILALYSDLDEILDWEHARLIEGTVLMHA